MHRSYEELAELKEAYRYAYRQLARWCVWLTAAVAALTTALIVVLSTTNRVEYKYFAVNRSGQLVAMDRPKIDEDDVTGFAVNAVRSAYTFTFNNWRRELQEAKTEFFISPSKFESFVKGLREANILPVVRQDNLSVTATAQSAPVIQRRRQTNGWRTWDVTFNVQLKYVSSERQYTQSGTAFVTVRAQPVHETPKGMAIKRIVIK